jgi:peptide/nickel transport system permease protein
MPEPVAEAVPPAEAVPDAVAVEVPEDRRGVEVAASRKLGFLGWFSIVWLTLIGLAALLAPWLPIKDPDQSFVEIVRRGPVPRTSADDSIFQRGWDIVSEWFQSGHKLGGDGNGRDVLARVIWGGRWSLLVAVGAVLLGLVVGGVLGLLAGYFRGWVDTVLTTLFNVLLSIPALVLALSLVAVMASSDEGSTSGERARVLILALGIVSVPILGRITRASTLSWSERDFVKAAEVAGAGHLRIMVREVLPNVLPAMMSITLLGIAVAIVAEGGLALLGVGIQDDPTWGRMIAEGRTDLARAPHIVGAASVAIFLTVLSLNQLGDIIRARFDVREAAI